MCIANKDERGIGLIEILFSILIIAIAAGGIMSHAYTSLTLTNRLELSQAAHGLALSKVELLSSTNTSDLTAADNSVESNLTVTGMSTTFTRTTTIVVAADDSRHVTVSVSTQTGRQPVTTSYETTWAVWE